jgi:dTDP-4-dehydrorhamnose 3,5-epimerase
MIFTELALKGVFLIEAEPYPDDRGLFARTFCAEEFARHGLNATVAQCNVSYNRRRGTLRGLHFQVPPHEETKLVRCTAGAVFDVIVDIRCASATCKRWLAVELSAANRRMLYIPEGFAHGFQTLVDDTELSYQMSRVQVAEAAAGLRWDDPELAIEWPAVAERVISARDLELPTCASLVSLWARDR